MADVELAPEPRCLFPFSGSSGEAYAVRFIQHVPEQPATENLHPLEIDQYSSQRLEMGYALKHCAGKRTTFSQAQKDIMVEFYNRQAINRIRADPKDVIKAMEAGLEVLSATQIKSWWSSYHRKNKQTSAQARVPTTAEQPSVTHTVSPEAPRVPPAIHVIPSASVPPPTPSASVPPPTPSASVPPPTPSASVPHSTSSTTCSVQCTIHRSTSYLVSQCSWFGLKLKQDGD